MPDIHLRVLSQPVLKFAIIFVALIGSFSIVGNERADAALPSAQFPTMSFGQDGPDVLALQYIMRGHGMNVTVTGTFDQPTADNISTWQSFSGQPVTGNVYPTMMSAPFVPIIQVNGSPAPDHVRAIQTLLQKTFGGYSAVTGNWDALTKTQVQAFQTHIAESATGTVDITTWRHLFWHYQQIPANSSGACWVSSVNGSTQWATADTYSNLRQSAARLTGEVPASGNGWWGYLALNDVSAEHGGYLSPHESHQVGRDADVRAARADANQCAYGTTYQSSTYSVSGTLWLTWTLHQDAGAYNYYLKLIFFNDPAVRYWYSKVQYYPGHDDHLHVRYCSQSPSTTPSYLC
jgi:hypothetical protein